MSTVLSAVFFSHVPSTFRHACTLDGILGQTAECGHDILPLVVPPDFTEEKSG